MVPLFQRPYVWKQSEQWEPLWADIVSVANRMMTAGDNRQGVKPHFIGAIVLDAINTPTGHLETRLIIDGQQRLTTTQLLFEAFADICAEQRLEKHHRALVKLTRNDDPMSENPDEVFKVWPTVVDQDHFRKVMHSTSPAALKTSYNCETEADSVGHPLADGYLFFHAVLTEWLSIGQPGFEKRVEMLYETLRDKLRMVVIDLHEEDDAQVIFETLNARGTPLLPSDLVKNFLFHRAQREGKNVQQLYDTYWKAFDAQDNYWREKLGRGHAQRPRIDYFLQNYLSARKQDEVATAHLYTTFREYASNGGSATDHLAMLRSYASVYQGFDSGVGGKREQVFFESIRTMEMVSVNPFVLELYVAHKSRLPEILQVLVDVESFLVRRMVCGLNTRGYNRFFVELIKKLPGDAGVAERVRAALRNSTAASSRWPDDKEFKEAWLGKPIYEILAAARLRMLLEALEMQVRTEMTEPAPVPAKLQVEHILPQAWKTHWALPPDVDPEEARQRRNVMLHTLGNLTLLTERLNPSVSNGPWSDKKAAILEHTILRLNLNLGGFREWNEAAIQLRAQSLFEAATRIWPFPPGPGRGDAQPELGNQNA